MPTTTSTLPSWWSARDKVTSSLPSHYTIRPLEAADYDRGYLQCLSQLTLVGDVSREQFLRTLDDMQRHSDTYMPIVIVDSNGLVAACGTLVVERKFIHQCGSLAHIEDIVVSGEKRGMGLGKVLIEQLKHLAFKQGCYKITLDCDVNNEPFYSKSDFETKGLQMCIYYRDDPATTPTSPKYTLYQQRE